VSWRHREFAALGSEVVALSQADTLAVAHRAYACASTTRYGLDETIFTDIDRLDIDEPGPGMRQWLGERVGGGALLLVFAKDEVFQVSAQFFLDRWQDLCCPSRDDVVILPVGGGWALFYCHEDVFEFGRGDPA
jgi:hypothetical protein